MMSPIAAHSRNFLRSQMFSPENLPKNPLKPTVIDEDPYNLLR